DRRPFDFARLIKGNKHGRCFYGRVGRKPVAAMLRVAEQREIVRMNGIASGEIRVPTCHSDLITLETPGVTFYRLHERTSFPLLGSAAFPEPAAAQARLELPYRLGLRRIIMSGKVVGVQRQIGLDSF